MDSGIKRFQECNWIEKLWRYRWYLAAPFIYLWRKLYTPPIQEMIEKDGELVPGELWYPDGKTIWKLVIGEMQMKMHWYYTSEEVFKRLHDKMDGE